MLRRLITFLFFFLCTLLFLSPDILPSLKIQPETRRSVALQKRNSSKCVVRPPDPWDQSILEYVRDDASKPAQLACPEAKVQPELTFLNENGVLHLNQTALKENSLEVDCQFRSYDKKIDDDENLIFSEWTSFNTSVKISTEFVEVSCQRSWFPRTRVYSNNHNQIVKISSKITDAPSSKPSVIVIVLDSVSHSNFRRTMNKTLGILQNRYGSFVFDGMTKVGDNSISNAVGFLAGKWYNSEFGDVHGFFDDHDIIWKRFAESGYRTHYAEDYPGFNLFNYLAKGFRKKPVDHYFRPFWLNVYWSYVHRRSKNLCYGNHRMHNLQLNYLSQFISKYKDQPRFAVSWFTELGHDWLNQVRYGDADIADFLQKHVTDLEDSFLVVMSDHGHRFDSIRKTSVGRMEERLPFFSLAIPKKLREDQKLVETIRNNTKVLTSFFDLYATFRHILTYPTPPRVSRGISLLTPVQERSCDAAHVPEEFCVCEREVVISTTDPKIRGIGDDLMVEINRLLEKRTQCAQLTMKKIVSASRVGEEEEQKYRVAIEASPSSAIFEALLFYDSWTTRSTVIGDINRINKYGSQSLCVDDQFLRKLCFCSTFIDSIQ